MLVLPVAPHLANLTGAPLLFIPLKHLTNLIESYLLSPLLTFRVLPKYPNFLLKIVPQQFSHHLTFFRTITFTFSASLYHSYPFLLHTVNEKNISKFYLVLLHVSPVLLCIFRTELNTEAPPQASLPLASLSSPICLLLFVRANRPL